MSNLITREELVQQIESAFGDSYLPSGDELLVNPQFDQGEELIRDFKGKHWRDITLETLYKHRLHLPLFTVDAFRYFLPTFLSLPLQASPDSMYNPDEIMKRVFYSLISPAGKQVWTLKLKEIISELSVEQKSAVIDFIQYVLQNNPQVVARYSEQVKTFWHI